MPVCLSLGLISVGGGRHGRGLPSSRYESIAAGGEHFHDYYSAMRESRPQRRGQGEVLSRLLEAWLAPVQARGVVDSLRGHLSSPVQSSFGPLLPAFCTRRSDRTNERTNEREQRYSTVPYITVPPVGVRGEQLKKNARKLARCASDANNRTVAGRAFWWISTLTSLWPCKKGPISSAVQMQGVEPRPAFLASRLEDGLLDSVSIQLVKYHITSQSTPGLVWQG